MSSFSKDNKIKKCQEADKCLLSLQLVLDGEASLEQEQYFMTHLDECLPCFHHYNMDKAVKELIRSKIEKKNVPLDLINKIKRNIFIVNETAS